jgi:hypothetical protein
MDGVLLFIAKNSVYPILTSFYPDIHEPLFQMATTTIEQHLIISALTPLPSSEQVQSEVEKAIESVILDISKVNNEVSFVAASLTSSQKPDNFLDPR